ncbi:MAG: TatD DNase family protein [Kosmotogales bacterium]|nr:TatD DNase family protein [Kosmotogales bacterium]
MTETSSISGQMPEITLCDTHTHLWYDKFDHDRDRIIDDIKSGKIKYIIDVGTNLFDSEMALNNTKKAENIFASVGIHPHDSEDAPPGYLEILKDFLSDDKVVAIGEIGLDYFRNLSPREVQKKVFIEQISLAKKLKKPIIVHIRDAYDDAYQILKEYSGEIKGVIHSFSSDYEYAEKFISLGFKLGIGGPVTYKKNEELREVVKKIDLKYLLCETDCPYLPPVPFRGKRNEPEYVEYTILKISEIKDIDSKTVSEILCSNGNSLFNLNLEV